MNNLKEQVVSLLPILESNIKKFVAQTSHGYETFGKEVETPCVESLLRELKRRNLINDFKIASHKNEFPDLAVVETKEGKNIAIDVKSSNHSTMKAGMWRKSNTPANDLGTFKTLPEHVEEWGGENIYFLWVHYNFTDEKREIVKIEFDNFYKFVGVNKENLLKYRIADGKIRPKTYSQKAFFNNYSDFYKLFEKTNVARKEKIIMREFNSLDNESQRAIINKMTDEAADANIL